MLLCRGVVFAGLVILTSPPYSSETSCSWQGVGLPRGFCYVFVCVGFAHLVCEMYTWVNFVVCAPIFMEVLLKEAYMAITLRMLLPLFWTSYTHFSSQRHTQKFFFWGGVQQIQLRTEDRENRDLGR